MLKTPIASARKTERMIMRKAARHPLLTFATTFAAILVLSAEPANAGKVYKWVDQDGITQLTAQPPPTGHAYEEIKVSTGKKVTAPANSPVTTAATSNNPTTAGTTGDAGLPPKKDKEACKKARANLENMKGKARIRLREPSGEEHYLTDEERVAAEKENLETAKKNCD